MDGELRRNIAWIRREQPVIQAGGEFGYKITMNPFAIVEGDTIFLFYAADSMDPDNVYRDGLRRREIHLATASVKEPEQFTHYGAVVSNTPVPGAFDYAWCVLPHVVKIRDGRYLMVYSGNCGYGKGLNSFPGMGIAWSEDLYHWEKYENNPVLPPTGEPYTATVGNAGGGLYKEDVGDGYLLHLFYTAAPTLGDNVFTDQQKTCNYATSTDGIHWNRHGTVHRRSTARDYENIAATGGPVLRDADGLWRHWYSSIGSRWGVYSVTYAESFDGFHWNMGTRFGENLALGPKVRDVGELRFMPWKTRWQDQSVSYPSVIEVNGSLRMYYCGNDYGEGGIGTAVAAPMRLALTGETCGSAKIWVNGENGTHALQLCAFVESETYGRLSGGVHEEGITCDTTPFFEEFPEYDGYAPMGIRAIAVHNEDGIRIDWMVENRTSALIKNLRIGVDGIAAPFALEMSDAEVSIADGNTVIHVGDIPRYGSVCVHGVLKV